MSNIFQEWFNDTNYYPLLYASALTPSASNKQYETEALVSIGKTILDNVSAFFENYSYNFLRLQKIISKF